MLIKIIAVFLIGILGGLTHRLIFEKKFYFPRRKKDLVGEYIDFGWIEDAVIGVMAAFAISLPIIEHVPVLNLIATSFLPAMAGKTFLKTSLQQYMEKERIDAYKRLENMEKEENRETLDENA